MALSNLAGWAEDKAASACGAACGASDKPEEKPAACGTACGAADKPAEDFKPNPCLSGHRKPLSETCLYNMILSMEE